MVRRGKAHRLHDLELMLFAETSPGDTGQGAILVSKSGSEADAVWLPKPQIEFDCPGFDSKQDDLEYVAALAEVEEAKARSTGTASPSRPAAKRNLGRLSQELPRLKPVIEPASLVCPCACGAMATIGEDVTERLDIVPAQFRVAEDRSHEVGVADIAGADEAVGAIRSAVRNFCRPRCRKAAFLSGRGRIRRAGHRTGQPERQLVAVDRPGRGRGHGLESDFASHARAGDHATA